MSNVNKRTRTLCKAT